MPTRAEAERLLAAIDAALADRSAPGQLLREIRRFWVDHRYSPAVDGAWTRDPDAAARLDVSEMRRALTFYMRAERFAEGSHTALLNATGVGCLRARLAALLAEGAFEPAACWSLPDVSWVLR